MKQLIILIFSFLAFACSSQESGSRKVESEVMTGEIADGEAKIVTIEPQKGDKYKIVNDIPVPEGYERVKADENSFGEYLRKLTLKTDNNTVYLFDGSEKWNKSVHFAVIKIDVGKVDLQQCADAVMRLRAEYLFHSDQKSEIHFNFTSGDVCSYSKYKEGYRARISGNKVIWTKSSAMDSSYTCFRNYMDLVFTYAGTASLEKELKSVEDINDIRPGDVFIQGGHPGHAITVMDVAVHKETGKRIFMLSQSYMPAQEIHILRNYNGENISPWYQTESTDKLYTPEWTFHWDNLKRF